MALVELDFNPDTKTLRSFGFIALGGFGLLGLAAYTETWMFAFGLRAARVPLAAGLGGLGALSALLSVVAPRANRPIFVGLSVLAFPIGWVISHALFGLIYFAVVTPIAIVFRLVRRDELGLRGDTPSRSYWSPARADREPDRYFKQF